MPRSRTEMGMSVSDKVKIAFISVILVVADPLTAQPQARPDGNVPLLPMFWTGPDGVIRSYVLPDDYPRSLTHGEQGDVEFRFVIGTHGSVTSCLVTESSG